MANNPRHDNVGDSVGELSPEVDLADLRKGKREDVTMWRVEKFLPPECPCCQRKFDRVNEDWQLFLGDMVGGQKRIRETKGYQIIACVECSNMTAMIPLEAWQLFERERAEALLRDGFVNLQEVRVCGNMMEENHTVYFEKPRMLIEAVPSEE